MSTKFISSAWTTLDLADDQFIKIRSNGYAIFFKVVQTRKGNRWTFTRETKAELFLDDPKWSADILAARLRNLLIDCWRSKFDKDQ